MVSVALLIRILLLVHVEALCWLAYPCTLRQSSQRVIEAWQEPNICSQICGKGVATLCVSTTICSSIELDRYSPTSNKSGKMPDRENVTSWWTPSGCSSHAG